MRLTKRPPRTVRERILAVTCTAGFAVVLKLYGLVMALPILVGYGLYRLLDAALSDARRPLAPAIAVPFAHAFWGAISLAFLLLTRHPLPPYAATEVALLAGFPFLMLYFPAIVPAAVLVAFQAFAVHLHIDDLLDPVRMTEQLELHGFPADAEGLRRGQMSVFAHLAYRVVSIAATLGGLFAYYWPRAPRRWRADDDVFDLTPVGGGYLQPWVRDAEGNYRRG